MVKDISSGAGNLAKPMVPDFSVFSRKRNFRPCHATVKITPHFNNLLAVSRTFRNRLRPPFKIDEFQIQ